MFKKSLSVLLAVMMIFGCMSVISLAADKNATVSLRIEGIKDCLYYSDVTVKEDSSVFDVLKAADEKDDTLTISSTSSEYGAYIYGINGIYAGSYTALKWDGWLFKVNDVEPNESVSVCNVKDGDSIVFYYGDPYNTGMQYPVADTSKLSEGLISFASTDVVYDEFYNAIETVNPVKDYTLIWGVGNEKIELTPDENGVCKIPYKYLTFGSHTVQIEKYDAKTGLPTVLRFAPDYSVKVSIFDAILNFFKTIIESIMSIIGA